MRAPTAPHTSTSHPIAAPRRLVGAQDVVPAPDAQDAPRVGRLLGRFVGLLVCLTLLLAGALALLPGTARAQDNVTDPPARVGRIARIEGRVTLQARDSSEDIDAPRNWPVTSGDLINTGDDARAELRVGATVLRLGENARLRVVRLDDDVIELHLQRGHLALMPGSDAAAREITLSSAAGRFTPQGEGYFRIDAGSQPGATAWRAALAVEQVGGSFMLRPGQYAQLYPEGGWRLGPPVSDDFAHWSMQPDEPIPASVAASDTALLPPDMTGAEDLGWYGDWQRSDDWGPVWFPRDVRADWAPYREGRWAWVAPWGWTWIDDAPWGFAPFHYGRWVHWRGRWGWVPGESRVRPVYAPALVAWGDQPGAGVSIGRAMVWFPLGPREIFVPSYRSTPHHRELINLPYLRQPVPFAERHRYDNGPRRDLRPDGRPDPRPFYRYGQIDYARSALPRNLFEQARRPIDTVQRRDERPPIAPGRGLPPRDGRDRRDQRDGGGNRIESIQLAPGLREAIGGTERDGRADGRAEGRPAARPDARPPVRDGRDRPDGRGGRADEVRPAVPSQPAPPTAPPRRDPAPAPIVAPITPVAQPPQALPALPGALPDGRGQARPEPPRHDGRGEGRGGDRWDRGGERSEGRPGSRDGGREPGRDGAARPPAAAAPGAAQPAPAPTPSQVPGQVPGQTPTQRPAVPARLQPPATVVPVVVPPAAPPAAAPVVKPAPVPAPAVDAGKPDGRPTPGNNEQRRRRGDELR